VLSYPHLARVLREQLGAVQPATYPQSTQGKRIHVFRSGGGEETGSGTEESSARAHPGCSLMSVSAIHRVCFRGKRTASGPADGPARWRERRGCQLSNICPTVKQLAFLFDLSLSISLAEGWAWS